MEGDANLSLYGSWNNTRGCRGSLLHFPPFITQVPGDLQHTSVPATVAAVRPWRDSRAGVAQSPKPGFTGASFITCGSRGVPPTKLRWACSSVARKAFRRRSETSVYIIFYEDRQGGRYFRNPLRRGNENHLHGLRHAGEPDILSCPKSTSKDCEAECLSSQNRRPSTSAASVKTSLPPTGVPIVTPVLSRPRRNWPMSKARPAATWRKLNCRPWAVPW
jgi:hypothetical protein